MPIPLNILNPFLAHTKEFDVTEPIPSVDELTQPYVKRIKSTITTGAIAGTAGIIAGGIIAYTVLR